MAAMMASPNLRNQRTPNKAQVLTSSSRRDSSLWPSASSIASHSNSRDSLWPVPVAATGNWMEGSDDEEEEEADTADQRTDQEKGFPAAPAGRLGFIGYRPDNRLDDQAGHRARDIQDGQ